MSGFESVERKDHDDCEAGSVRVELSETRRVGVGSVRRRLIAILMAAAVHGFRG